jgi:transaldolase
VKLNVTALLPLDQVRVMVVAAPARPRASPCSRDAWRTRRGSGAGDGGRGRDVARGAQRRADLGEPAELLNIFQADEIGCHIITVTHDILKKLSLVGRDLHEYSLDTVKMFHGDAAQAGFSL